MRVKDRFAKARKQDATAAKQPAAKPAAGDPADEPLMRQRASKARPEKPAAPQRRPKQEQPRKPADDSDESMIEDLDDFLSDESDRKSSGEAAPLDESSPLLPSSEFEAIDDSPATPEEDDTEREEIHTSDIIAEEEDKSTVLFDADKFLDSPEGEEAFRSAELEPLDSDPDIPGPRALNIDWEKRGREKEPEKEEPENASKKALHVKGKWIIIDDESDDTMLYDGYFVRYNSQDGAGNKNFTLWRKTAKGKESIRDFRLSPDPDNPARSTESFMNLPGTKEPFSVIIKYTEKGVYAEFPNAKSFKDKGRDLLKKAPVSMASLKSYLRYIIPGVFATAIIPASIIYGWKPLLLSGIALLADALLIDCALGKKNDLSKEKR